VKGALKVKCLFLWEFVGGGVPLLGTLEYVQIKTLEWDCVSIGYPLLGKHVGTLLS